MSIRITRRALARGAGLGVLMALIPREALGGPNDSIVSGTIESLGSRSASVQAAGGQVRIEFTDDARFFRDGPATLADFHVGDRVAVAMTTSSPSAQADLLETLYFRIDGNVLQINASQLVTTGGEAAIDGERGIAPAGWIAWAVVTRRRDPERTRHAALSVLAANHAASRIAGLQLVVLSLAVLALVGP